jgi:hypothetical protein
MSCERCGAIENIFESAPCWHCNYPGRDSRSEEMIAFDAKQEESYEPMNMWDEE